MNMDSRQKNAVIGGRAMKNKKKKKLSISELQKQLEDMKVTMLAFTKCVRRIIQIFWQS